MGTIDWFKENHLKVGDWEGVGLVTETQGSTGQELKSQPKLERGDNVIKLKITLS